MFQISHSYITAGKTITLTIETFVSKVMSPIFNALFRFVMGLLHDAVGKQTACNAGDLGSISVSGRHPAEGLATHSCKLTWRIPWTGEPGMGLQETDTT